MVVLNDSNDQIQGSYVAKEILEVSENRIRDLILPERCKDRNGHGLFDKDHESLPNQTLECYDVDDVSTKHAEGFETKVEHTRPTDQEIDVLHLTNGDESAKLLADDHFQTGIIKEHQRLDVNQGTENVKEIFEKTEDKIPIDRGWAWIILLASVCVHFIVIGQLKCFGIIFVQLQKRYGSSSSATSVIYTLMNATYSVSALIIMTVGGSMSARTSFFIGGTITSVASMITAFIDDVRIAMVTLGVASGLANAFLMTFTATIINTYFVEKRGLANNIGNCGVSLGTIALAPIVTKLFEYYSYTGTYIILTGFNLQLFAIACLLRPMSFYKNKCKRINITTTNKDVDTNESGDIVKTLGNSAIKGKTIPVAVLQNRTISKQNSVENPYFSSLRHINENVKSLIPAKTRRRRAISESETEGKRLAVKTDEFEHASVHSLFNSDVARFTSTDIMNTSLMDLTLVKDETKEETKFNLEDNKLKGQSTCTNRFRKTFLNSMKRLFDTKLLSKPEFQYFLICNAFLCAGCSLATAFLAPLAYDNGIDNDMVALMISVMSIVELLSRFVIGYISDKKWCHRSTIIAVACLVLGLAAEFLHFMTTFSTLMIYAVISGLLQGVYFSLFVVVILDILSFEEFKGALGFTSLVQGVSSGICMPIVGYLKDTTGTYTYPYNLIGTCLIFGAVLTYFIPNIHEWSLKREKNKSKDTRV